ncbi:SH3 domain-containing protein [Pontibacter sp. G13]|uniref:SH3 domain-containing protein n=1 Tax=Pontibacter sp. G13 TaxID=3074898 RepID=UPI002889A8EC|nr:SH3 domain-containing protein [Pontibacter sp. G13]WNJ16177.1 SH3 domain-containing protein [Pontibacter sp. G13]
MNRISALLCSLALTLCVACEVPAPNQTGGKNPLSNTDIPLGNLLEGFEQLSSEVQELSRPNQVQSWVEGLIVKVQPGKDMPEIGRLKEGEIAEYLYQRTIRKAEFTLRGQKYRESWILIKTQQGLMGWVHEGGVRYLTPEYQQLIKDVLNGSGNPNQRSTGPAQNLASDRLIVPGKQVGAIKVTTAFDQLIQLYGYGQLAEGSVSLPDGKTEPCTVVFPRTANELRIVWKDEQRTRIKAVYLDQTHSAWFTKEGLTVGLPLMEVTKLNQAPVNFYGFDWAYGGTIAGWRKGRFERFNKYFYAVLTPTYPKAVTSNIKGNQQISSNHEDVAKIGAYVSRLVIYLD